ncbi:MAG: SufE family protein [Anaerolineaceae bacterium]|jgi:cysteine desulfuration protein SufE|nr:SufE family protein [Anaerolineaceae bacterium]HQJ32531.1 SufE family protein [Anaerolineaceae bacterium]
MPGIQEIQKELSDDFSLLANWEEKYEYLIEMGMDMPAMKPENKVDENLVKGCQSSVWFDVNCQDGMMVFEADSDSLVVKGMVAILYKLFNHQPAKDVLEADLSLFEELGLWRHLSSQRSNGLTAMVAHLKAKAADCLAKGN